MNRRKTLASEVKIPDRTLDDFLVDLANANPAEDTNALFRRYSQFLPTSPTNPDEAVPLLRVFGTRWAPPPERRLPDDPQVYKEGIIAVMRDWLQAIWNADDENTAEWVLFQFQSRLHDATGGSPLQPPSLEAPLSQALAYLRLHVHRLRKCINPSCATPLFVAAKPERKHCSKLACAAASQSKYKTGWWQDEQSRSNRDGKRIKVNVTPKKAK